MISVRRGWVFIHPTKTAGTSIAAALLPYSDDQRRPIPGMDPQEDFEISGPITTNKHSTLRYYRTQLGSQLDDMVLIGGARHPVDRMLSLYFYWQNRRGEPVHFNTQGFINLVAKSPTLSDMYRQPDGTVRRPDILVEPGSIAQAVEQIEKQLGITGLEVAHYNKSARHSLVDELRHSSSLTALVREAHHEDYQVFGYPDVSAR